MNRTRVAVLSVAAIAVTACALAIAIGVAPAPSRTQKSARRVVPTAVDPVVAVLSENQARLDAGRGAPRPGLTPARRNPFHFVERTAAPGARPTGRRGPAFSTAGAEEVTSAAPPVRLIGIAEDRSTGALVRTAIVSTADGLFLVKEGERFAHRFEVRQITASGVQLRDVVAAADVTLAFR